MTLSYRRSMTPEEYLDFLELSREATDQESYLRPAQLTQIFDVEEQLGVKLPKQYEEFLTSVGCGEEHGGMGRWYHLDLTRPGNVVEISRHIPRGSRASGMLPIYDAYDGDIYGFLPNSNGFYPQVHVFDSEAGEMKKVSEDLEGFLDCLASPDEKEFAEDEELGEFEGFFEVDRAE